MLQYENQILLDMLHEDGLLIAARGLSIEQILINLLCSYSDEGNLILIIGTSNHEEEFIISEMQKKNILPIPKCITADCSTSNRTQMYLNGGCLFVTSRILVVDLLMDRVPANLITGIVVWKAHRIIESHQEAFILRLYRQKNKTGFIKAFSSSPLSFTVGFCHVERIMKNLFVKKLYLWPRFHIQVSECLNQCKLEVIELHIQMTSNMKQIQIATLDLISSTLQELKLSNRAIDFEEFCVENAISKYFEKMIKMQLDPYWHQLSTRTKQLIADLKVLRTILTFLTQYDSVTFYNLINSLKTTEKAMQSAGWMLLPSADVLFLHSKVRVFGSSKGDPVAKKAKTKGNDSDGRNIEVNPKWSTLREILDEIKKETEIADAGRNCLIVTQDDRTSNQIKECLDDGPEEVLERNFYRSFGNKLGLPPPPSLYGKNEKEKSSGNFIHVGKGHKWAAKKKEKKKSEKEDEEEITLTQMSKKYPLHEDEKNESEGKSLKDLESTKEKGLSIYINSLKDQNDPFKMKKILYELSPHYILMYDSELEFVREVEVWQARNEHKHCRVYFLIYKGTIEEQIYLTNIKREKDAFEFLIKEKASMVMPEYAEGRHDDHPDLIRETLKESEENNKNAQTRKAGNLSSEEAATPKVIVDMREFRSDLPSMLHKKGIDIDPATIEIGDYILTPEICVERKSISDLIGSLTSGRLYNQAQAMTRYYKKPILLIEFDHNKPFHLQGRLFLSTDSSSSSKDVSAKLQLLTLHFPFLRIIWSPSPFATAELFYMLKKGKPEPSVDEAQAVNKDANSDFALDNFNPLVKDFIAKLPGITSKNLNIILRNVKDLPHLLTFSFEEINQLLENSKNAKLLYEALHGVMREPSQTENLDGKRMKFGKKPLRRK